MIPFIVGIFLIFYTEEEEREMPSDLASDWETDEMGKKQIKQKKKRLIIIETSLKNCNNKCRVQ